MEIELRLGVIAAERFLPAERQRKGQTAICSVGLSKTAAVLIP